MPTATYVPITFADSPFTPTPDPIYVDTSDGPVVLNLPTTRGGVAIYKISMDENPITIGVGPLQSINGGPVGEDVVLDGSEDGDAVMLWTIVHAGVGDLWILKG